MVRVKEVFCIDRVLMLKFEQNWGEAYILIQKGHVNIHLSNIKSFTKTYET